MNDPHQKEDSKTTNVENFENPKQEAIFRIIKCIDIAYTTVIQFLIALVLSFILDRCFFPKFGDRIKSKSTGSVLVEVMIQYSIIGLIIYGARNIIPYIPFPLDGYYGFSHDQVKEVANASIFGMIFLMTQKELGKKTDYLYNEIKELNF